MEMGFLDDFNESYSPQSVATLPLMENIPDGDYDCTIMSSVIDKTKTQGIQLLRLEVKFESINKVAEHAYFLNSQENINRLAGDLGTLGFPVGTWGKGVPLSKAIPDAAATLPGKRFRGTKKTKKGRNGCKDYHNLYINAHLADDPTAAEMVKSNNLAAATAVTDEFGF